MKTNHSPRLYLLLLVSVLLNAYFIVRQRPKELRVASVIDGDTFILENEDRIRLLGVNAPEMGRCYASEAQTELASLVVHKPVRLEEERRDSYGRRMGLVYVNNRLVNTAMIEQGFGKPDYTKNSKSALFIQAYNQAKENHLGVNSEVCKKTNADTPPNPTCVIKGNIDKASGDKFYHLPSCRHYNQIVLDLDTGENYFCTETDAKAAGFIQANDCLR